MEEVLKVKRNLCLILCILFFIVGCSKNKVNSSTPMVPSTECRTEVKGLVLKYVLIDTAYEIYQVNAQKIDAFSEQEYASIGKDTHDHYLWLIDTYEQFDEEMKIELHAIFESIHPWALMNQTTPLKDHANVEEIIGCLHGSNQLRLNKKLKKSISTFFPYFYYGFLQDYLEINQETFDQYAEEINQQLNQHNANIIEFMEKISGLKFKTRYKPIFYYTLRPIGAMGFNNGNKKISTLQRTCRDDAILFSTPFHEFSHELFQQFTKSKEFKNIGKQLKQIETFEADWINGMQDSYSWLAWCEENLVEGFAKYLRYKYYGTSSIEGIYTYDEDFFNYLKDLNFDASDQSLKEASILFYTKIIEEQ